MPKLKTHKGVKKRVRLTKKGKLKRSKAFAGHLMASKSAKRRRQLRKTSYISTQFEKKMRSVLH